MQEYWRVVHKNQLCSGCPVIFSSGSQLCRKVCSADFDHYDMRWQGQKLHAKSLLPTISALCCLSVL